MTEENNSTQYEQDNKSPEKSLSTGCTTIIAFAVFFSVLLIMTFISVRDTVDPSNTLSP